MVLVVDLLRPDAAFAASNHSSKGIVVETVAVVEIANRRFQHHQQHIVRCSHIVPLVDIGFERLTPAVDYRRGRCCHHHFEHSWDHTVTKIASLKPLPLKMKIERLEFQKINWLTAICSRYLKQLFTRSEEGVFNAM